MNTLTKKGYVIPAFRTVSLATEYQFMASQLDDYDDNPIFGAPGSYPDDNI